MDTITQPLNLKRRRRKARTRYVIVGFVNRANPTQSGYMMAAGINPKWCITCLHAGQLVAPAIRFRGLPLCCRHAAEIPAGAINPALL